MAVENQLNGCRTCQRGATVNTDIHGYKNDVGVVGWGRWCVRGGGCAIRFVVGRSIDALLNSIPSHKSRGGHSRNIHALSAYIHYYIDIWFVHFSPSAFTLIKTAGPAHDLLSFAPSHTDASPAPLPPRRHTRTPTTQYQLTMDETECNLNRD